MLEGYHNLKIVFIYSSLYMPTIVSPNFMVLLTIVLKQWRGENDTSHLEVRIPV